MKTMFSSVNYLTPLLLGAAAMFRPFVPSQKVFSVLKYMAGVAAVFSAVYIAYTEIANYMAPSPEFPPVFYVDPTVQRENIVTVVMFLFIATGCFFPKAYTKTRCVLVMVSILLFLVSRIFAIADPVAALSNLRFLINTLLYLFAYISVLVCALFPLKTKERVE